jgi:hypothetical protein
MISWTAPTTRPKSPPRAAPSVTSRSSTKNPRSKALKEELETEARARKAAGYTLPENVRYNERSASERVNARVKDDFGGRNVRVRGHAKVLCHMFAVLALATDQIMRLIV